MVTDMIHLECHNTSNINGVRIKWGLGFLRENLTAYIIYHAINYMSSPILKFYVKIMEGLKWTVNS